ncbi:hypothetical protein F5884DRAFT_897452 [Xylogone sp. PMI_703]|nr:hypothetical protein F5884DRAFT_897452 [Xylogone sp. PMI_703]
MTSSTTVTKLVQENLREVFGESDPKKRLSALSRLWVPSSESLFVDPLGVFRSHEAISDLVGSLHVQYPGMAFSERGEVQILYETQDEDFRVARLQWGHGTPGEEPVVTGEDVVTIVGGKIKSLYTFLN